jgi:hypothetical protein
MGRWGAPILAGAALFALPAAGAPSGAGALASLEKGRWQVREMGNALPAAAICLGDPAQLVQFVHRGGQACRAEILESAGNSLTVQYRCPASGFGHSHVRVETPRTVRVETQGLRNGRPFSYRLEARRVGAC